MTLLSQLYIRYGIEYPPTPIERIARDFGVAPRVGEVPGWPIRFYLAYDLATKLGVEGTDEVRRRWAMDLLVPFYLLEPLVTSRRNFTYAQLGTVFGVSERAINVRMRILSGL